MNINNHLNFQLNNIDIENRKLKLDSFILKNNSLIFEQNIMDLNKEEILLIIIQNVKTKEEFICKYLINKNSIIVLLDSLVHLFTNYEGEIRILSKNIDKYCSYTPILKDNTTIGTQKDMINQYTWFTRVLENGQIRLSSIIKKQPINE